MHYGKLVFSQLMAYLPLNVFARCVAAHRGEHKVKDFSCLDQFFAMAFAQLTYRESLRDIEVNLRAQAKRLYHMGFRCATISRNTLANANANRPWQIYADLAQHLIGIARPLYANEPLGVDLDATVYAFDATTIDLCLSVYPWAPFRRAKAAIKLHTLLDLRGSIPGFIHITDGKTHEVNVLDDLVIEPGAFYLMDRGYLDFARHVCHAPSPGLLCHSRQEQLQVQAALLASGRSLRHASHLRPDGRADRVLFEPGLSDRTASRGGQGRHRQAQHVSDQ